MGKTWPPASDTKRAEHEHSVHLGPISSQKITHFSFRIGYILIVKTEQKKTEKHMQKMPRPMTSTGSNGVDRDRRTPVVVERHSGAPGNDTRHDPDGSTHDRSGAAVGSADRDLRRRPHTRRRRPALGGRRWSYSDGPRWVLSSPGTKASPAPQS